MDSSGENGFPTDAVHVNAGATFQVIKMDVAKLCDEVSHTKLFTDLPSNNDSLHSAINKYKLDKSSHGS